MNAISAHSNLFRRDLKAIGLVDVAHGTSHFSLILAPSVAWIEDVFSLSCVEHGFLMTVFFIVSGVANSSQDFMLFIAARSKIRAMVWHYREFPHSAWQCMPMAFNRYTFIECDGQLSRVKFVLALNLTFADNRFNKDRVTACSGFFIAVSNDVG